MSSLSIFGKVIYELRGDGYLETCTGLKYECKIHAVQLSNGKIFVNCIFDKNMSTVLSMIDAEQDIKLIHGIIDDNQEIRIEGNIFYNKCSIQQTRTNITIDIIYFASKITVEKIGKQKFKYIKFGLTNFEYFGNKTRELPDGGMIRDILSINLDDKNIEISQLPEYKSILTNIKNQKLIDVTCEAVIEMNSLDKLDKTLYLVNSLCELISFANGTKINWIYYYCCDEIGDKLMSSYQNRIVWQYSGSPLIDTRNPHDLPKFLAQTYTPYVAKKEKLRLDVAIDAYLDAKRELGYLETRALRAVVVLEFLKSVYAIDKNIEFIVDKKEFKKLKSLILSTLDAESINLSLSEKEIEEIEISIISLNRRSFRRILHEMLTEYQINITEEELLKFINIRNSLVHRGTFLTKEYWQEYIFIIKILDRIFLRILEYTGIFLDISNQFKRVSR